MSHSPHFESMKEHYREIEEFLEKKLEEGYILNWIHLTTRFQEIREDGFIVKIKAETIFHYKPPQWARENPEGQYLGSVN